MNALHSLLLAATVTVNAADTVSLTSLDLTKMQQGWGKPQTDRSMRENPLQIAGRTFAHGVGTHARSTLWIQLDGQAVRFSAWVGVDDAANSDKASITFKVAGDNRTLWESGVMRSSQPAKEVNVSLAGVKTLTLLVGDAGDGVEYDHGNWAEAQFVVDGARPVAIERPVPKEELVRLTPKPGPGPRINGPTITGCRPGNPFLFRVPTTGERPMTWTAGGLPEGLVLDPNTGIITGPAPARGKYEVTLRAENRHGTASRVLRVVSGDTLALTPTMGWNHWYAHYNRITDAMMREAADLMVSSGMADVGYQYVSIDDCWMNAPKSDDPLRVGPLRDGNGRIVPNRHFPDMNALTDHIHGHGLKAGIYTSPGPFTCAGFSGSYQYEALDAQTFAEWGFDLLKHDWCSFGDIARVDARPDAEKFRHPYQLMGRLLQEQPRDIVLNLCQYGMGEVWKWGAEVGGHSWRTAGDLGFELDRVFEVALKNAEHAAFQRPGAWNDPDYLQIGYIGAAHVMGEPRPCPLTPSEQYAYISLWALMASPLFYSGDMTRLDEFTLNVLCNPEVIDVNQDALGQCGRVVPVGEETFLMVKELEDGSRAVGLFNRGELATPVTATWEAIGVSGRQQVRDVWRHQDLGGFDREYVAEVPRHGAVMIRLRR
ncbi:MAG: NPCBM/NEW2 domain-containing protein [Limisphaerales bacterium]